MIGWSPIHPPPPTVHYPPPSHSAFMGIILLCSHGRQLMSRSAYSALWVDILKFTATANFLFNLNCFKLWVSNDKIWPETSISTAGFRNPRFVRLLNKTWSVQNRMWAPPWYLRHIPRWQQHTGEHVSSCFIEILSQIILIYIYSIVLYSIHYTIQYTYNVYIAGQLRVSAFFLYWKSRCCVDLVFC